MSRAKELLKAGLENRGTNAETARPGNEEDLVEPTNAQQLPQPTERSDDLEAVLLGKQPPTDRLVKRTFEMRESHVEVLNRIVKKAKNNGTRITQSDALQFIISNWNGKFGGDYLD